MLYATRREFCSCIEFWSQLPKRACGRSTWVTKIVNEIRVYQFTMQNCLIVGVLQLRNCFQGRSLPLMWEKEKVTEGNMTMTKFNQRVIFPRIRVVIRMRQVRHNRYATVPNWFLLECQCHQWDNGDAPVIVAVLFPSNSSNELCTPIDPDPETNFIFQGQSL